MKISEHDNYIVLEDDRNNLEDFASFLEYIVPKKNEGQNVVVDLSKYPDLSLDQLLLFLTVSNSHRKSGQSFVLVTDVLSPDDLPDELAVVPTIHEAEDFIGMEDMERGLGF